MGQKNKQCRLHIHHTITIIYFHHAKAIQGYKQDENHIYIYIINIKTCYF